MRLPVVLQWELTGFSGWGNFGCNLIDRWFDDPAVEPYLALPTVAELLPIPSERARRVAACDARSADLRAAIADHAGRSVTLDGPVLHPIGRGCAAGVRVGGTEVWGQPTIGLIFNEEGRLRPEGRERLKRYRHIVAGSQWALDVLRAGGIARSSLALQGFDAEVFQPGPKVGAFAGRFAVFSGGRLEFRKGQDIVLTAFARFRQRHPDALLVTAWSNLWPGLGESFAQAGIALPPARGADGGVDIAAWIAAHGIPDDGHFDLGLLPNADIANVLREVDAAIQVSRAEAGSDMVAVEALACGVPTILSANTGHLDIIDLVGEGGCHAVRRQTAINAAPGFADVSGWGDSDPDEIVDALERIYADSDAATERGRAAAGTILPLAWGARAEAFKHIILREAGVD